MNKVINCFLVSRLIAFIWHHSLLQKNSGDDSPCIQSTITELTYYIYTDPRQSGRLSDRYALLQCFARRCVPFVSLQTLILRRVFASAFPSDSSHALLSVRCFLSRSVISGSEGGHDSASGTGRLLTVNARNPCALTVNPYRFRFFHKAP